MTSSSSSPPLCFSRRSALALMGALAFALAGCHPALSIEDACSRSNGSEVTVEGAVTVPGDLVARLATP